mmetsp:Transcript_30909/g.95453  ORF Transcript_30909/g.95453 Transcript_30909/m.95453 type:complete len:207 (+) Transcript_30909:476-1096(+)
MHSRHSSSSTTSSSATVTGAGGGWRPRGRWTTTTSSSSAAAAAPLRFTVPTLARSYPQMKHRGASTGLFAPQPGHATFVCPLPMVTCTTGICGKRGSPQTAQLRALGSFSSVHVAHWRFGSRLGPDGAAGGALGCRAGGCGGFRWNDLLCFFSLRRLSWCRRPASCSAMLPRDSLQSHTVQMRLGPASVYQSISSDAARFGMRPTQ